ncbi:lipoate--protein ligase family protein [Bacillus aquiflavi]|uniref:Octanoyl-[GcvH]:protein N-octanoyltransferase n=1 Tax=Bacillus aquiflavi TaxID=2672567 RepID=A0A6B3W154_9BACI|nr:biotin/lipoate A/B protein ligase family protein [Bacillus aquiflavi]MBA4537438.1 lipoate--protein ligase family protein [Bacillus aquiflavi]NEY81693.1 lipoate--protein ligase family protein [Bacillus aquiflavi]
MEEALKLLRQQQWRIIDQSALGGHFDAIQSFAIDDTLCASVGGQLSSATARAWVHHDTVVLGIQDTKLPYLKDGLDYLQENGFHYIVRNSGGLAVVLDKGVLNLTLVLPEAEKGIDINRGYDAMWALVQLLFSDFKKDIEAKEIVGSYCPGSYDLSMNGKKFAGISQRRLRNGVAVQIYLSVTGSGSERANLLKQFYLHAKKSEQTKLAYPNINPDVMASLSELLSVPLTIQDVMQRFLSVLQNHSEHIYIGGLTSKELSLFSGYMQRMIDRNKNVFQS